MSEFQYLYTERDVMQLDKNGNYYCKHVAAMTREGLHSKSDIAAELGFRDSQIDQLKQENTELREAFQSIKNKFNDATSINEIEAFIYMICENKITGDL